MLACSTAVGLAKSIEDARKELWTYSFTRILNDNFRLDWFLRKRSRARPFTGVNFNEFDSRFQTTC